MRLSQSITERTSSIGTSLTASSEATGGGRTNLVSGIIAILSGPDFGTELHFGYENSFLGTICIVQIPLLELQNLCPMLHFGLNLFLEKVHFVSESYFRM